MNSRDRQLRSCGEGLWEVTEKMREEDSDSLWAWKRGRGSAEGSDAAGEGGSGPLVDKRSEWGTDTQELLLCCLEGSWWADALPFSSQQWSSCRADWGTSQARGCWATLHTGVAGGSWALCLPWCLWSMRGPRGLLKDLQRDHCRELLHCTLMEQTVGQL